MIGLGVGIDYALFLITRHQEQLRDGMADAATRSRNAVATSGSAIVFAGGTVVIALLSLGVAGIPLVSALGLASAIARRRGGARRDHAAAGVPRPAQAPDRAGRRCRRSCARPTKPRRRACGIAGPASYAGTRSWSPSLSLAFLVPLIIPAFSLELGQEDIGATDARRPPSARPTT